MTPLDASLTFIKGLEDKFAVLASKLLEIEDAIS